LVQEQVIVLPSVVVGVLMDVEHGFLTLSGKALAALAPQGSENDAALAEGLTTADHAGVYGLRRPGLAMVDKVAAWSVGPAAYVVGWLLYS
jgi:hypothetical protein